MKPNEFPSPLTTVMINGKESNYTITLPEKEKFRINHIFVSHEYGIPRHLLPERAMTVVDVGANVGLFTLYMKMTQSVEAIHCFEPAPSTLKLLRLNIGSLDDVSIYPFGLADRNGSAELNLHPLNTGQNSLRVRSGSSHYDEEVSIRDAGETFMQLGLTTIDILKIDTEGWEVPILKSLSLTLDRIGIVLLEYHSDNDRRTIDQLLSRFKLIGAKATQMDVGTLKYIHRRLLVCISVEMGRITQLPA